ncbi:MAG: ABC transporter ATP-binding protein/permease [Desulfobulbaceae bacterium]|nr:ABC transporter ATP-binding protein/permease [Desulfobulbaceae bacterium]
MTTKTWQKQSDDIPVCQRSLFYWILRKHRGIQLLLLVIILTSLFFRVFPLEMQRRIINEAIHLRDEQLLFLYCGLYIGAVLLAGITKYLINVIQTVLGQKILMEMRTELYHHILQLPLQFYRKMQPGTVISAMTAELNSIGFFLGGALAIPVTSILSFLVFVGFMFTLSPLLTLLSISIYPLELIVIPLLQKRYNRLNKKRIKTTRAMANVVNEAISGIHEIHANAAYDLEEKRMAGFIDRLYSLLKRLLFVKYGIKFANNLFQSVGPFILFLIGGYLAINGQFTLGALVAFLSAYEKVYDPWKEMLEYYQALQDAQVRYKQIMQIFDVEIEHLILPGGRGIIELQGAIELKNVGFTVESGVKLLSNITMQIRPNEQVALVGFSGSGKSTLALLMAQLYKLSSGSLQLDGYDINTMSKADISRNITMIAQHPFIFTGTIRDNLLYSVRAAADGEQEVPARRRIMMTIRDVGLEEDILRFGLNSVIPYERVAPLKRKFLRMRHIIIHELHEDYTKSVEIYDARKFLHYSTLRDNLIFGDSLRGRYTVESMADDHDIMELLTSTGLENELVRLGLAIARVTIELLGEFGDDEFFFRGNPMESGEFERYNSLVQELGDEAPQKKQDRTMFLKLALRFIPGRHNIVTMDPALESAITEARETFLNDIVKVDLETCCHGIEDFQMEQNLLDLPRFEQERDFIAYCPSEYLYSHTLLDNLLFGALKEELRENQHLIENAMDAFRRERLVDEIIDVGLDFNVGSQGDRLSGGQKQKVAIARAFLKQGRILIMDEATASLDNTSQGKIQQVVDKKFRGKKTIIAVIHRLDLTPSYDRIFVLKAGSIIEQGSYDELMAQKGAFYELAKST